MIVLEGGQRCREERENSFVGASQRHVHSTGMAVARSSPVVPSTSARSRRRWSPHCCVTPSRGRDMLESKDSAWRGRRPPRGWRRMVRKVLSYVRSTQSAGATPVPRARMGFVRFLGDRSNVQAAIARLAEDVRFCPVCNEQTRWRRGACANEHEMRYCRECRGVQPHHHTGECVNNAHHPVRLDCRICGRKTRHDREGRCYNIGNHDRVSSWCSMCARETRRNRADGRCVYSHGYEE